MRIWNLTPHEMHYDDGVVQRNIASDGVLRLEQSDEPAGDVEGLKTVITRYGAVSGVPAGIAPGDVLIISTLAGDYWKAGRPAGVTILVPDTGPTCKRDAAGRIVAVSRFIRK